MADKQKKMSPKEYSDYLQKVDLVSINFKQYNVKSQKAYIGPHMKIDVKYDTSYELEDVEKTKALTTIVYKLTAYKNKKSEFVLKIDCTIQALLEAETTFKEDFLDIYLDVNLNLNTWPYFRAFVQDAAQRIGIPPLTLPFYRI